MFAKAAVAPNGKKATCHRGDEETDVKAAKEAEPIRKSVREQEVGMRTILEKAESGARMQSAINAAIEEVMKREGCSRTVATDRVILGSPALSDAVRLERRDKELERNARQEAAIGKTNNALSITKPGTMRTTFNPGGDKNVESADSVLQRIADEHQARDGSMSRAKAVAAASLDPRFSEALRRERIAKFG